MQTSRQRSGNSRNRLADVNRCVYLGHPFWPMRICDSHVQLHATYCTPRALVIDAASCCFASAEIPRLHAGTLRYARRGELLRANGKLTPRVRNGRWRAGLHGGLDVLVQAEEVRGVVLVLQFFHALVVVAKAFLDTVFALIAQIV